MPCDSSEAALGYPEPPLAAEEVRLRPWRDEDLPAVVAGFNDPAVRRFIWPRTTSYTAADAREWYAQQETNRLHGREICFALVEPTDDHVVLGGCSVHDVDLEQGRAAVGYWLDASARGRGVATAAVRLLAGWAFEGLGVARLELTCEPDNHASQQVAERCGFVREGVLRSHLPFKGRRRDSVVFGLLPSDRS